MIVVTVHLVSARDGSVTELARGTIANSGAGLLPGRFNYACRTFRGRSKEQLDRRVTQRDAAIGFTAEEYAAPDKTGGVADYPRESLHVWNLIARALEAMGYG